MIVLDTGRPEVTSSIKIACYGLPVTRAKAASLENPYPVYEIICEEPKCEKGKCPPPGDVEVEVLHEPVKVRFVRP